jgi:hypothetical protein
MQSAGRKVHKKIRTESYLTSLETHSCVVRAAKTDPNTQECETHKIQSRHPWSKGNKDKESKYMTHCTQKHEEAVSQTWGCSCQPYFSKTRRAIRTRDSSNRVARPHPGDRTDLLTNFCTKILGEKTGAFRSNVRRRLHGEMQFRLRKDYKSIKRTEVMRL